MSPETAGADVQYIPDLNKQFIKPSNQWLSTRTYTLNSNKPLNATQLSNQFYDTTLVMFYMPPPIAHFHHRHNLHC